MRGNAKAAPGSTRGCTRHRHLRENRASAMAYYDRLPPEVRKALQDAPTMACAYCAGALTKKRGAHFVVARIEAISSRIYAAEQQKLGAVA